MRERVLGVDAAGLDALVAEDALAVVAHVEVVVDLHRLGDGLGPGAVGRLVVAGLARVPLAAGGRARGRTVPLGPRSVAGDHVADARRGREIHGGGEQLQDHSTREAHPLGVGEDRHPRLDLPRAGGDQHARARHLDHAHPADVDRRQRLEKAQGGDVDAARPARLENGGAGRHLRRLAVDDDVDGGSDRPLGRGREAARRRRALEPDRGRLHARDSTRARRARADSMALEAVWPRPQMEASRMT